MSDTSRSHFNGQQHACIHANSGIGQMASCVGDGTLGNESAEGGQRITSFSSGEMFPSPSASGSRALTSSSAPALAPDLGAFVGTIGKQNNPK